MENETDIPEAKVGLMERFRAYVRGHTPTTSREVDRYLSLSFPDLIERHNLALRSELRDVDEALTNYEMAVDGLESWREETGERMQKIKHRMELLEKKHGIKRG